MRVIFHGSLSHLNDRIANVRIGGRTPRQVLEILVRQIPELRRMRRTGVKIAGCQNLLCMDTIWRENDLHVLPAFTPSGGNTGRALGQILLGSLLILGSFLTSGTLASFLFSTGVGLLAGGLLQLLAAAPEQGDRKKSAYLGPPRNTVGIGQRIPYAFGTVRMFGHVIASDTDVVDVG